MVVKVISRSFGAFPIFRVFFFDNLVSRKWLVVEQHGTAYRHRGYFVSMRYFWLLRFHSPSEVIRYIPEIFSNLVSWKRLDVEQTDENLGLGVGIWSIVKCSRSVMHLRLSDFRQPCVLETAGCRVIGTKIWTSMYVFNAYRVLLTVKCSRSFWDHSVRFQLLPSLYLENG